MPAPKNTKKTTEKNRKRLRTLYLLGSLLAVSNALPAYLQSNFLGQFMDARNISLVFAGANFLAIFAIWFFPGLIKKLTNYILTRIVLILFIISLLGLAISTSPIIALSSIILFIISVNLIWINMDVAVESFSSNSSTGQTRTLYFTFINAGWILAPIMGSYLISKGGYSLPFLLAASLVVPFFLIFTKQKKNLKDNIKYKKESPAIALKKIWKNKNLKGIFFVALLLQLFYTSPVVYIPLYLHQTLNIGWEILGPMFSIMLIPFIIIEVPAGIIADKWLGEKEMLYLGFLILSVSLFLFFYINTPIIWLWTLLLFFSRIGAALVEAMRESYFFKLIDADSVSHINVFRLTAPLSYIIGPGIALIVLSFLPINYLFLIVAIIMTTGFGFVSIIKDTK